MAKKDCTGEFATEKQKMKNVEKVIFGNGDNGIIKKLKELSDDMIVQKERNSFKMWVYRTAIGVLIAIVSVLAQQLFNIKIGG